MRNISKDIFSINQDNWYNSEGFDITASKYSDDLKRGFTTGASAPPLNLSVVYDISHVIVKNPVNGEIYYDASGIPVNFPVKTAVYDEIGNIIVTPPLVGFMVDYTGYPIDLPLYDLDGNKIEDLSNFFGPVYDSYHNQIKFPCIDSNGKYTVSPVMTPTVYKNYIRYTTSENNTTSSNGYSDYNDASCVFGCVNYNQSLDSYISDYYQHFWNQYKQMYTDDYVLKTSIPNIPNTQCDINNLKLLHLGNTVSNGNPSTVLNELGKDTRAVVNEVGKDARAVVNEVGKDARAVVNGAGDTIEDIGSGAQKLVSTVGGDIQSVAGAVGNGLNSALRINPTNLQGQYVSDNNRGLAGNYRGDNTVSNTGYMNGNNPNSGNNGIANYDNHYNAKLAQTSNFMPMTADFSKFGR